MKKLLCITLIVIILFNFIITSVCYATPEDGEPKRKIEEDASPSDSAPDQILNEGYAGGQEMNQNNFGTSIIGFVVGILGAILDVVAGIPFIIMNLATNGRSCRRKDYGRHCKPNG